jgi:hypothetical protein
MNPNSTVNSMRQHRYGIHIVVSIIVMLAVYYAYFVRSVSLKPHSAMSSVLISRIAAYAQPYHVNKLPFCAFEAGIKRIGMSISYVTLNRYAPFRAQLTVKLARPCAVVNNEYILTTGACVVPLEEYASDVRTGLPHLTVLEPCFSQKSREACCQWVEQLPPEIIEHFSVTWYARSSIELRPRSGVYGGLTYQAWCSTSFSLELLNAMRSAACNNKRVDLRIPQYVIVSPISRGRL